MYFFNVFKISKITRRAVTENKTTVEYRIDEKESKEKCSPNRELHKSECARK